MQVKDYAGLPQYEDREDIETRIGRPGRGL